MTSELKACPAPGCGAPALETETDNTCCSHDGCQLSWAWFKKATWNRRAPSPAVARLVEACRKVTPYIDPPAWHDKMIQEGQEFLEALAAVEKEMQ